MRLTHSLMPTTVSVAIFLTACGGGGGTTSMPEPVKTLASLAAKDIPAQWPENFKAVTLKKSDLVSDAELTQTTNQPSLIFIQVWYLDQSLQRQSVAVLTLDALTSMGGGITISNIPGGVQTLKSEVYTPKDSTQQTLATKEFTV